MTRSRTLVLAALAAVALLAGSLPGHATTAPGDGSARSQVAEVTQGGPLTTTSKVDFLGLGLDTVTAPLTSTVINPLLNALVATPAALATSLTNALVGSGLQAQSADGQQPRPTGYPTCGQQGWNSGNCYGPLAPTVMAAPLLVMSTGAAQGYATGDATGYAAAARVANPQLNLLGLSLGDLGLITSAATCATTAASCTANQNFSGGSLLGGHLVVSFADGGPLVAKVDGVAVPAGGTTLNTAGFATTITATGNLATITVGLTLTQLLNALGLPNLLSSVGALGLLTDNGSAIALTIKIGPGSISRTSPVSAWGLNISVDLTANVKLKLTLAGLTLATVGVTAAGPAPDLVNLKLAYSTATAGNLLPGWIPPALI